MAASPTLPLRDREAITAPTMSRPQPAASRRRTAAACRSATDAASGRTATILSARSFGFLNMPPTAPCTRPFSTRFDPPRVIEDGAKRDVAGRQHDEPRELLDAPRGRERVDHQHEDEEHFHVHVREGADGAAHPDGERRGRENDRAESEDADEFRRDPGDRKGPAQPARDHRAERRQGREFCEVQRVERRKLILRAEEQQGRENHQAGERPVAPFARRLGDPGRHRAHRFAGDPTCAVGRRPVAWFRNAVSEGQPFSHGSRAGDGVDGLTSRYPVRSGPRRVRTRPRSSS